ncbi:uncharacterized protein LOC134680420, partial [Cydia fagiglandana]|uniref:uncharacterized protein LOC134680420 n=1 Tax=Cydia fagiglandana TaxID=1458189 RepID=UPI002FEDF0C8
MERQNNCVSCNRSVLRRRKHVLTELFLERHRDHAVLLLQEIIPREIRFDGSRAICHACWVRFDRHLRNEPVPDQPVQDQPIRDQPVQDQAPPQVEGEANEEREVAGPQIGFVSPRGYLRASNTARHCIFANCRNVVAHNVPQYAKFLLLHNHNFYIPELARVCNAHFMNNDWEDLLNNPAFENFNSAHVVGMMQLYKWGFERRGHHDFENIEEIDENECQKEFHFWTGVTKYHFNVILNQTPSLRDRSDRPATVLGMYLTKIRTGEPDERLATRFSISRRTLERNLAIARECLRDDFVPQNLGLNHITREQVVARNLAIPSHFFGGNQNEPAAILVYDGTYIYLQKSANLVDVTGPYTATTSDA